jgi:hypothetical protein
MGALLVSPKSIEEQKLLLDLLKRLGIPVQILSEEEREDWGLSLLMQEANREEKVTREEIFEKLSRT